MNTRRRGPARSIFLAACWGLAAVAAAYVLVAHKAHVIEYLPFALLLACPLMHIFMHGRHGHHQQSARDSSGGAASASSRSAQG